MGPHHIIVVALLLASNSSVSASNIRPPNQADWTQGIWEMVSDESAFCKPTPRVSIRQIIDVGWGMISVHWTGIDASGNPIDSRYVYRYDGDRYPANIQKPATESISWKLVNPKRVDFFHWSKDGRMTEELSREVSDDGQKMTQLRRYLGGSECVDKQVFRRR
jgi:hypothetical protein